MKRTFHDLGKLSKAMVAPSEPPPTPPPVKPAASSDGAYVLEYFSRGRMAEPARAVPRHKAKPSAPAQHVPSAARDVQPSGEARCELEARIRELESRAAAAEARAAAAESRATAAEAKLAVAANAQLRLQAECSRLSAELASAASAQSAGEAPAEPVQSAAVDGGEDASYLLSAPSFEEIFPGELREHLLDALADAQDDAARNGRERRAAALSAILSVNAPSGELKRRRASLRQILKDAGAFNDGKALARLEKLGFRLISGKKHWKLEYAGIRFPLAKTPSDHRSHLNTATDVANRCL